MEVEAFRKIYPSEFYRKFLVHNVRPDGRGMMKVRKTAVSTGNSRGDLLPLHRRTQLFFKKVPFEPPMALLL